VKLKLKIVPDLAADASKDWETRAEKAIENLVNKASTPLDDVLFPNKVELNELFTG
jgi:hypothetical protein